MNKIFPIRVERTVPQRYKIIEWKIHNTCNYDCSFCGINNKDGSERWFSIEKYKEGVDKIVRACKGAPFYIQFTGGEPTLYPKFIELLTYAKSRGAFTALITNGSRTIRWWQELLEANVLDSLSITYHSEQTIDYKHVSEIMNMFHSEPVEVICEITHTKDCIPQAFDAYNYLINNTGSIINLKAMSIGFYDIYSVYTHDQLQFIKEGTYKLGKNKNTKADCRIPLPFRLSSLVNITYNNGSIQRGNHQSLIKGRLNSFIGWDCNVGRDFIRIIHDKIFRGVCEIGGIIGSLNDDEINFTSDFIKCTIPSCVCFTDLSATKIRNTKTNVQIIPASQF